MKTVIHSFAVSATFVIGAASLWQPQVETCPTVPAAIAAPATEAASLDPLGPGHHSILNQFRAILTADRERADYNQAAIDAVSELTASLTPERIQGACDAIREAAGCAPSEEQFLLRVDAPENSVGYDLDGKGFSIGALDLHDSRASMWDLCAVEPAACELAKVAQEHFPHLRHGTYSATIGGELTVGVFGQDTVDGRLTTVLVPMFVVPDASPLIGWQYAEFLLLYKDEQFDEAAPEAIDFLFAAGTDTVIGVSGEGDCLTQAVIDCITQRLGELLAKLAELEKEYKKQYNRILAAAQRDAARCSPIHSVQGFLRCVLTLGIEPIIDACNIWEDFAADVADLNADFAEDVCDAHKEARDRIMDCLADCPQEIRDAIRAQMDAALASMGCN